MYNMNLNDSCEYLYNNIITVIEKKQSQKHKLHKRDKTNSMDALLLSAPSKADM